jgi:hypothetical protein
MTSLALVVFIVALLIRRFLDRNMPRVGGKIGGRRPSLPAGPLPDGFSGVDTRAITVFGAPGDATRFTNLRSYLRRGTVRQPGLVRVYRVAACGTAIEIPAETADYNRIEAAEVLTLLRELPDPRLVTRLQLSDEPCFLDPWTRKITGRELYHLGNATKTGLVVLYRPDRRLGREIGVTLMHEWLHLLAFKSAGDIRRFGRANAIEPPVPPPFEPVAFGIPKAAIHEAWADLGEKLLGYDEEIARLAAMTAPVHAVILWQRIDAILGAVPTRLHSTRHAEFEARAAFMRAEVAPKARAAGARRPRL